MDSNKKMPCTDLNSINLAENYFDTANYNESLEVLESLGNTGAINYNKNLIKFLISMDVDSFIKHSKLMDTNLSYEQKVLHDYNLALALASYKNEYGEAIQILDKHYNIFSSPHRVMDVKLESNLAFLMILLYVETKYKLKNALELIKIMKSKPNNENYFWDFKLLKARCNMALGKQEHAIKNCMKYSALTSIKHYFQRTGIIKIKRKLTNLPFENNIPIEDFYSGKKLNALFKFKTLKKRSKPENIYNNALIYILTGNLSDARKLFQEISANFSNNPKIWLKLAECCIHEMHKFQVSDFDFRRKIQELISGQIIEGENRKIILKSSSNKIENKELLLFARQCLMNSINLIINDDCSFYPSDLTSNDEIEKLKVSIFLTSAYVSLCLCDYHSAYQYSIFALEFDIKGIQLALATLYKCEALIWLDKVDEAIKYFSQKMPTIFEQFSDPDDNLDLNIKLGYVDWDKVILKIIFLYNQAAYLALNGDFAECGELLVQISQISNLDSKIFICAHAFMLAIYYQLKQGCFGLVKSLIQKHLPQYN